MLEGGGFEVTDLGVDVSPDRFVAEVARVRPQIVGLSALLSTTMPAMETTIAALRTAGLRDRVKVVIGGAPVTAAYARAIGADGYAESAATAVAVVRALMTTVTLSPPEDSPGDSPGTGTGSTGRGQSPGGDSHREGTVTGGCPGHR
jgi:cobalamin-dependent methionine synthase I